LSPLLRPLAAPAVLLGAATLALWLAPPLPPSLAGLRLLGPWALLAAGLAMSTWFNRGRAFFFLASLAAGYGGYQAALALGGFAAQAAFVALALLVPLNTALALALPERGVRYHGAWRWFALIGAEALAAAWIGSAGRSDFSGLAWIGILDHWLLRAPPTPLAARAAFVAALVLAAWRAAPKSALDAVAPLDAGMVGALAALYFGCEWARAAAAAPLFVSASAAILIVGLLQESHRLAFGDPLTGLPARRALEERMRALGPVYSLAMVDVDHFKQFNDTHGHDVGDQVLKLVAARLAEVEDGGAAFRYGGEEFTVLFPERPLEAALEPLERLRASIAAYRMAVRGEDRPRQAEAGLRRRAGPDSIPAKVLSVTVSIGAAEPSAEARTPAQVLKAADQALYRAKQGGRNRVCR